MAALMLAARWVVQQRLCFPYSLLFVWDTGEEGLGNLNGVRGLMEDYADRIAALVALDGVYPGLIDGAVGSVRWRIRAKTSGGHSFRNFGSPNAIERMAALIGALYAQPLPDAEGACTTFNVGSIAGGTSVNTIAQACEILYEVRSDSAAALNTMECALNALVRGAQQRGGVDFSCEEIGRRPAPARGRRDRTRWNPIGSVRCRRYCRGRRCAALLVPPTAISPFHGHSRHVWEPIGRRGPYCGEWIDCASLSTGYALLLHLFHSFAQEISSSCNCMPTRIHGGNGKRGLGKVSAFWYTIEQQQTGKGGRQMQTIPVIAVAAWSGTGKTTLLERLIPVLKERGLRVCVMKHDAHEFEVDRVGKDSWRMTRAGADVTILTNGAHAAILENRPVTAEALLEQVHDVDLVLTEGYKHGLWKRLLCTVRRWASLFPALWRSV